ncbi:late competence protein ComEC, DNA transport [Desulfocucumis palustris]|uniref:Late competence protein ComEC, DNA transport n=1 Tax=Desulfocucumis palustris TaxID=1898651 RepID=A0A2L2XLW4_9FIRM|nr:ComEC/Rec2 family competence protein [Desulfocucumis palustris]GBF35306.1 late competence protein ComEC, DNA transport [Desulfocucumis palustris]
MPERPLLGVAAAYIAGMVLSALTGIGPEWPLLASMAAFLSAVYLYLSARRGLGPAFLILFALLGMTMSGQAITGEEKLFLRPYWGHFVTVEGTILDGPDIRSLDTRYLVKTGWVTMGGIRKRYEGKIIIRAAAGIPVFNYGHGLKARGYLSMPEEPGNPGQFNYRSYLSRRGIGGILAVNSGDQIDSTGLSGGNPLVGFALAVKSRLLKVAENTLSPARADLLNGIIFGVVGEMPPEEREIFCETGVNHILSVSGLHVGMLLAAMAFLLGMLNVSRPARFITITCVLIIYAVMTGLSPPVVRATIMALVLLLGHQLGREADWPTSLGLAALAILFFQPWALFEPGFQLSFCATWGILYLTPAIRTLLAKSFKFPPGAALFIAVPLAAQLGTVPLIAIHFNLITAASLPANLIAVPITGVILPLGALAAITGQFSMTLAGFINIATGALLDLFKWLVEAIREIPGLFIYVEAPSWIFAAAWYLLFWALGKPVPGKVAGSGETPPGSLAGGAFPAVSRGAAFTLLVFAAGVAWIPGRGPGDAGLRVHFIDVGQGDSAYVEFPGGGNMLVDAGGRPGEFESARGAGDVVVDYLKGQGVNRLDVLVITHPHEDHAGGVGAVVRRFAIGSVVVPPLPPAEGSASSGAYKGGERPDPAYGRLLEDIALKGIPVEIAVSGDRLKLDREVGIEVINPAPELMEGTRSDLNNNSLVLMMEYRQQTLLLAADIEEEAQRRILESGRDIHCTVLKVPHHGSRYISPEFFGRAGPRLAVISAGKNNNFGHPDPQTLQLLEDLGVRVYRTDRDGAVVVSTDGEKIRVKWGRMDRESAVQQPGNAA